MATKDEQIAEFQTLYADADVENRARIMAVLRAMHSGQITTEQVQVASHGDRVQALEFADSLIRMEA